MAMFAGRNAEEGTDSLLVAARDETSMTNGIKYKIDKNEVESQKRLCK